jgi:hypothetical protein
MGTVKILKSNERKVCNELLELKNITDIYEKKKKAWLDSISITKNYAENLAKANHDETEWNPQQLILTTSRHLSNIHTDFEDEIEKLSQKSDKAVRIYNRLTRLEIETLRYANQKAVYIFLCHMYEGKANEDKSEKDD